MSERGPGEAPFLDRNTRATNTRIQRTLTEMHRHRTEFQQARQVGQPDDGLHLAFQSRVLEAHDALRPYRDEALDDWQSATRWDEGLSLLPKAVAAKPSRKVKSKGFGRSEVELEYEPQLLGEGHLLEISYEIDEIARSIGFEVAPDVELDDVDGGMV